MYGSFSVRQAAKPLKEAGKRVDAKAGHKLEMTIVTSMNDQARKEDRNENIKGRQNDRMKDNRSRREQQLDQNHRRRNDQTSQDKATEET